MAMNISSVISVDLWILWQALFHIGSCATAPLPTAGRQVPSMVIVMDCVTRLLSSEKLSTCLEDTLTFLGV